MNPHHRRRLLIFSAALTLYSFITAFLRVPLRFDFFDMSGFLDAGYRAWIGQEPYKDFLYNSGPVHLWLLAGSFSVAGFGLLACQILVGLQTAIAGTAFVYLFRHHFRDHFWLLACCALLHTSVFYGTVNFPWYDQSAWLFLFCAFLFENPLDLKISGRRNEFLSALVAGALVALSTGSKTNVGFVGAGLVFTATCVRFLYQHQMPLKTRFRGLAEALAGLLLGFSIAFSCIFFVLSDFSAFYDQTIRQYAGRRIHDLERLMHTSFTILHSRYTVWCVLAAILLRRVLLNPTGIFLLVLSLASVFTTWTTSMIREANIPALGMEVALLAILIPTLWKGPGLKFSKIFLTGLAGILLFVSVRDGILNTWNVRAWAWQTTTPMNDYVIKTPGFAGWRCYPEFGQTFDRLVETLKTRIPMNESVAMVGDMTVAVGASGRPPYPGMPFFFHYREFPRPGKYAEWVGNHFKSHPPMWLIHHVNPALWDWTDWSVLKHYFGVAEFFDENYELKFQEGNIQFFRMKAVR